MDLEKKHKDMHALVKQVVEMKHTGKAREAEQGFSRVCEAAEEVVALISGVEAQAIGSRAHAANQSPQRKQAACLLSSSWNRSAPGKQGRGVSALPRIAPR